jgi:hypothetical protein
MLRMAIKLLGNQGEAKKTQLMIDAGESSDNPDCGKHDEGSSDEQWTVSSSLVKLYLSVCVLAALLILF